VQRVESAQPDRGVGDQIAWLSELEAEHDNLRAVLSWCLGAAPDAGDAFSPIPLPVRNRQITDQDHSRLELALRLAGGSWWFWHVRGYDPEGLRWLTATLEAAAGVSAPFLGILQARVLHGAAKMAQVCWETERGISYFEEAISLGQKLGDNSAVAGAMCELGRIRRETGERELGRQLHEQSLLLSRESEDRAHIGDALSELGYDAWCEGEPDRARRLFGEALELARQSGDLWRCLTPLHILGNIAYEAGDLAQARTLYQEHLEICERLRFPALIPMILNHLARIALDLGEFGQARRLLSRGVALSDQIDIVRFDPAWARSMLAEIAQQEGDLDRAMEHHCEAIPFYQRCGYIRGAAKSLCALSELARLQGDLPQAETYRREAELLEAGRRQRDVVSTDADSDSYLSATPGQFPAPRSENAGADAKDQGSHC
jgi:tetratricopeptide (TPR) repeat protein